MQVVQKVKSLLKNPNLANLGSPEEVTKNKKKT